MNGIDVLRYIEKIIDFWNLKIKELVVLSLLSGIILLLPDKILSKLYMVNFRKNYGFLISLVFLISSTHLFVLFLLSIVNKIKKLLNTQKSKKAKIKYLMNAEQNKVELIKKFIKDETHTLHLPMNDGLTNELLYSNIISFAGYNQPVKFGYDIEIYTKYFLESWVITLINEEPKLQEKYKIN